MPKGRKRGPISQETKGKHSHSMKGRKRDPMPQEQKDKICQIKTGMTRKIDELRMRHPSFVRGVIEHNG
jgi:hypothetical protein